MSDYPISCISCRRKKIKCNKKKPCNQCIKKGVVCEFPSKFRNINITNEHDHHSQTLDMSPVRSSSNSDSNSPSEVTRLHDEVELLRKEKLATLHENFKLTQKNHELRAKLQSLDRTQNVENDDSDGFEISGETTELGEKYYGPSSSNYMIEALRSKSTSKEKPESEGESNKSDSSSTPLNNEAHPNKNKRGDSDEASEDVESDSNINVAKKSLPWVIGKGGSKDDNLRAIKVLIDHFFERSDYRAFISKPSLMDFVDSHESITDKEWENDDDLLLLHILLTLSVLRLTPKEYNEYGLSKEPVDSVLSLHKKTTKLIKDVLYRGFTKLRHNLLNESIVTVIAYILCTEYYFIVQRYEESWSMLFHSCAVAYAIGLHVMVKVRTKNESPDEASKKLAEMSPADQSDKIVKTEEKEAVSEDDDADSDVPRFKIWFALKFMSGQLCSILGRPNPISIQVNSVVLLTSSQENIAKLRLDSEKTQAQLKMGVGECLRLSNMMLIESFMMNFTIQDVMRLDAKFKEECEKLTWFVSQEYQSQHEHDANRYDEICHMPLSVEKESATMDLIILHINRAKLLEPFCNQFLSPEENKYLLEAMCESISRFLDYFIEFTKDFLSRIIPHFLFKEGKAYCKTKLGKVFRFNYPFLNSFMYQGIIVIFTLSNYKAKEFIQGESDAFLQHVQRSLNDLIGESSRLSEEVGEDVRLWSSNILYLMNKDLQHVSTLLKKREEHHQNDPDNALNLGADDLDKILGFSFKDPFSLNAENIPYYLSSPSDDEMGGGMFEDEAFSKNMQPNSVNSFGQDVMNQYSMGGQDQYQGGWNNQRVDQPQQMSQGMAQPRDQAPVGAQVPAHANFANLQQPSPLDSRDSSSYSNSRQHQFAPQPPQGHHSRPPSHLQGPHQMNMNGNMQRQQAPNMPNHMNPQLGGQVPDSLQKGGQQSLFSNMMAGHPPQGYANHLQQQEQDKDQQMNYTQPGQLPPNMGPAYYSNPQQGYQGPN